MGPRPEQHLMEKITDELLVVEEIRKGMDNQSEITCCSSSSQSTMLNELKQPTVRAHEGQLVIKEGHSRIKEERPCKKRYLLSSQHNKTILTVDEGEGVRQYALMRTARNGRKSFYRCNKCVVRIRRGAEGRTAWVKTLDGEIIGDAHPPHVPGCELLKKGEVFVRSVLRECRRDVRQGKKAPRDAFAEGFERVLLAKGAFNKVEKSDREGRVRPLIPLWKEVRQSFYWHRRHASDHTSNPNGVREISGETMHLEPAEELLDEESIDESEPFEETLGPEFIEEASNSPYEELLDLESADFSTGSEPPEGGVYLKSSDRCESNVTGGENVKSLEADLRAERTFFVIEASQLMKLFKRCQRCGSLMKDVNLSESAGVPMLTWQCTGDCGPSKWACIPNI